MANSAVRPRLRGAGATPARSVRIPDEVWEEAKARAKFEKTNVSQVIYLLLDGYAKGKIQLPKVEMTYSQLHS